MWRNNSLPSPAVHVFEKMVIAQAVCSIRKEQTACASYMGQAVNRLYNTDKLWYDRSIMKTADISCFHSEKESSMRGAIFDMDGLLLDSERLYQQCWHDLAQEHGVLLPDSFAAEINGTGADLTRKILQRIFPAADPDLLAAECAKRVTLMEETELVPKEGAVELVEALHEAGWRLAVASSSPREMVFRNLEHTGFTPYFSQVLSGDDVARAKPSPDIFLLAAERLLLEPEDCLVLEDSPNGLRAARAAGCIPVMVPDQVQPTEELRSFCAVYPSLVDVLAAIRSGKL